MLNGPPGLRSSRRLHSMFLLLLVGFAIGNVAFGLTLFGGRRLDRWLGSLYSLIGVLTAFNISRQLGGPGLPGVLATWLYPVVQPATRVLVGVWLYRAGALRAPPPKE